MMESDTQTISTPVAMRQSDLERHCGSGDHTRRATRIGSTIAASSPVTNPVL